MMFRNLSPGDDPRLSDPYFWRRRRYMGYDRGFSGNSLTAYFIGVQQKHHGG